MHRVHEKQHRLRFFLSVGYSVSDAKKIVDEFCAPKTLDSKYSIPFCRNISFAFLHFILAIHLSCKLETHANRIWNDADSRH